MPPRDPQEASFMPELKLSADSIAALSQASNDLVDRIHANRDRRRSTDGFAACGRLPTKRLAVTTWPSEPIAVDHIERRTLTSHILREWKFRPTPLVGRHP